MAEPKKDRPQRSSPRKRSGLGIGFLFLLVAGGGAFQWLRTGTLWDQSRFSGELESGVNDVLTREGLSDASISNVLRRERKSLFPFPRLWVETERTLRVPAQSRGRLLRTLRAWTEDKRLEWEEREEDGRAIWEIRRGRQVFQRMILSGAAARGRAAIVIDDVAGRPGDVAALDRFFALRVPLTFAVLPMERKSREAAEKIRRAGYALIVHQPMEPEDVEHNPPGKAALWARMGSGEIARTLSANFRTVPGALGFSNHMGSRFTEDPAAMRALMRAAASLRQTSAPDFFFFDSHTSALNPGEKEATSFRVPYRRNDLFLDNADDRGAVALQLRKLKDLALRRGSASAIGHIQRRHLLEALRAVLPEFQKAGIVLVALPDLVPSVPVHEKRSDPRPRN